MTAGKSPFDDASGSEFLKWFSGKGGLPTEVLSGISTAGTDLAGATALSEGTSIVTTSSSNQGVRLPEAEIGQLVGVINSTANTIKVYPPTSTQIISYGSSQGAAASILTYVGAFFLRVSAVQWVKIAIA